jgi:hypothetical protein
MPLTELVVVISSGIAYLIGGMFWLAHCQGARRPGHPSVLRRIAWEPATVLLGGVPLFAALWLVVVWRILPVWS